ncbi:MAG: portal protein, partial [Paludibacteraceae bacterium]|nr:portal protein [Paludibacteraceae bacterium]
MDNKTTIYQRLSTLLSGNRSVADAARRVHSYGVKPGDVIFSTNNRDEYERKLLQLRQDAHIRKQWIKAANDITNRSLIGLNDVKMMYRDADLMDNFPEIGTALDIVMEEACFMPKDGLMVNVRSKSDRVKSILEDLLVNRLEVNIMLPMICRSTCKYGNTFMLLDMNSENGVTGWKQLPVYEVERYENGMANPYGGAFTSTNNTSGKEDISTKFVWVGQTQYTPYMNWQIAHFRLLYDSLLLPYGTSYLNKARRHFRMLSMMEDMMLIYRLERSIERRVFKINVGGISDNDVRAYVEEIANEFKRTPIIDPQTGQLDLRKNILNVSEDYFIPVRDDSAPNPIETLQGAQNMTAMDDIKFVENKVVTALRVPKQFLNFEEAEGDGKNLSLLDVRFTRTVNRIQQSLLMELNKICVLHLYLLGFDDELTNFTLSMNNPSSQAEMLEIENMAKKVTTAKDAISDAGNGIALMSVTRAQKEILGWTDREIEQNLEEMRLERALSSELEMTSQIIKRTGIFDPVDNIYGEAGANYSQQPEPGEGGEGGGIPGGGGFGGGGPIGDADFDMPEEETGNEGEIDMDTAMQDETGTEQPQPQDVEQNMGESAMSRLLRKTLNEERVDRSLNT